MRQEKILSNISFIEKLPDKGKKIKEKKENLQKALDLARNQVEDVFIPDIDSLEWQWRDPRNPSLSSQNVVNGAKDTMSSPLDSDDDEDPLELLANHSRDVPLRSSTRASDLDPSDVIRKELKKLELMDKEEMSVPSNTSETLPTKSSSLAMDFGSKLIISMEKKIKPSREVFKPFRPLKHQHLLSHEYKEQPCEAQKSTAPNTNEVDKDKCIKPCQPEKNDLPSADHLTKVSSNPHVFGGPAKLGTGVNISPCAKVSRPLNNRNRGPSSVKLVPLRESVHLQKEAMERAKNALMKEAAARCRAPREGSNNKMNSKYTYKDVNTIPHVLEQDDELNDVFSHYRGMCVAQSDSSSESDEE
ncbi:DNA-directed RNA polymerase II subunit GRINL1 [Trinorchestia longiramus]|nr:DNA-directed RNA polymerase II subunit GRINL1 [Trinorchestia longiramus]